MYLKIISLQFSTVEKTFRFFLRRKTNAETLKFFGDSFSLHKGSLRGLTEQKCQEQYFHFAQQAGSGWHGSGSPWDVQQLAGSQDKARSDFGGAGSLQGC